jgi:hypothetical protein
MGLLLGDYDEEKKEEQVKSVEIICKGMIIIIHHEI